MRNSSQMTRHSTKLPWIKSRKLGPFIEPTVTFCSE
jgi:hypothetical protein